MIPIQKEKKDIIREAVKRIQTYHKKLATQVATDSGHKNQNFHRKFEIPRELVPSEETVQFEKQQSTAVVRIYVHIHEYQYRIHEDMCSLAGRFPPPLFDNRKVKGPRFGDGSADGDKSDSSSTSPKAPRSSSKAQAQNAKKKRKGGSRSQSPPQKKSKQERKKENAGHQKKKQKERDWSSEVWCHCYNC